MDKVKIRDNRNSRQRRMWNLWGERILELANQDVNSANDRLDEKFGIRTK